VLKKLDNMPFVVGRFTSFLLKLSFPSLLVVKLLFFTIMELSILLSSLDMVVFF